MLPAVIVKHTEYAHTAYCTFIYSFYVDVHIRIRTYPVLCLTDIPYYK